MKKKPEKVDLHMHTTFSDGSDSPKELLCKVKEKGIELFSVTDHDALAGNRELCETIGAEDPLFVTGVEFSCKDDKGKYHILGYGYDTKARAICDIVQTFHDVRMRKLGLRLKHLKEKYGIEFSREEVKYLYGLNNPGKPHIAGLLVEHGKAGSISEAIDTMLTGIKDNERKIKPEEAIEAILDSGGIPVLAHGIFGSGSQLLDNEEMDDRVRRLKEKGLMGLECFYSGFSPKQQKEMLYLKEKYGLMATAGSDYHGAIKLVQLGDTGWGEPGEILPYLQDFVDICMEKGN